MAIRLVVLDIDGTIAGESNDISPGVLEAITKVQAQGIPVALATGRMYRSALRFHQKIQSSLPLITYNGALTQDPQTGAVHRHCPLEAEIALEIWRYFQDLPETSPLELHCYHQDQLYVPAITEQTQNYLARAGVTALEQEDLEPLLKKEPTKLLAISPDSPWLRRLQGDLRSRLTEEQVYFTQSTDIYFEITHPQATKGQAVQHLAETLLGLSASEVLAIGDNFNDLDLLQYAGRGVAMGNAPEGVKAVADEVTADVEADGVAQVLASLLA